jgi:hypothetical protein
MSKKKATGLRQRPSTPSGRRDDSAQSRTFIEKAREIEADEDRSAADELLGRLAKKPPEPRKPPSK